MFKFVYVKDVCVCGEQDSPQQQSRGLIGGRSHIKRGLIIRMTADGAFGGATVFIVRRRCCCCCLAVVISRVECRLYRVA